MQNHLFSILFYFSVLLALPTQGLDKLKEIVEHALPQDKYTLEAYDYTPGEHNEGDKDVIACANKKNPWTIPAEVTLYHILPRLVFHGQDLSQARKNYRSFALTCHSFRALTRASLYFLTDDCLNDPNLPTMPSELLRFKTHNTPDGLFKLANLLDVMPERLLSTFDRKFLESHFRPLQDTLPQRLEGTPDEELKRLYPFLKIGRALARGGYLDDKTSGQMSALVNERPQDDSVKLSYERERVHSLSTEAEVSQNSIENLLSHSRGKERDFIIRKLLIRGINIPYFTRIGLVPHEDRRDLAIQLMGWCDQNPEMVEEVQLVHNVMSAFVLKDPKLAETSIARIALECEHPAYATTKAMAFYYYIGRKIENPQVQHEFTEFSKEFYSKHWASLLPAAKPQAVCLLVDAKSPDVPQAIDDLLLAPDLSQLLQCKLIQTLNENGHPEEARKIVLHLLSQGKEEYVKIVKTKMEISKTGVSSSLRQCLDLEPERSIALLREVARCDDADSLIKLEMLWYIAKHAKDEENREFVATQLKVLNLEKPGNGAEIVEASFLTKQKFIVAICAYLGNREATAISFKALSEAVCQLDSFFGRGGAWIADYLECFQDAGIKVNSLEDLKVLDPFECMQKLLELDVLGLPPPPGGR
jgi:hypothetical protein